MDRFLLRKLPLCLFQSFSSLVAAPSPSSLLLSSSFLHPQSSDLPLLYRTLPVWFHVVWCLPSPPTRQRVPICLYSGSPAAHLTVLLSMSPKDLGFPTNLPPQHRAGSASHSSPKGWWSPHLSQMLWFQFCIKPRTTCRPSLLPCQAQPPLILSSVLSASFLRTSPWPTPQRPRTDFNTSRACVSLMVKTLVALWV